MAQEAGKVKGKTQNYGIGAPVRDNFSGNDRKSGPFDYAQDGLWRLGGFERGVLFGYKA